MFSMTGGVSLWYRPCYKNMLNYKTTANAENLQQKKIFYCRADTDFRLGH